ncbi:hypothetical protein [Pseudonocardia nigra]|uniref:hypothetical protein n=1 Tax=Pseudonocardia nigra TaxID=1921578 RepID=UPI001C5ECCF9|nr:hypothetical protein [Pseudonocardia nigra]
MTARPTPAGALPPDPPVDRPEASAPARPRQVGATGHRAVVEALTVVLTLLALLVLVSALLEAGGVPLG